MKRSLIRSRYRRHAATQLTHTAQRFNAILDPIYQDHQRTRSLQLSRRRREILHFPLLRAYAIQAVSLSTSLHLSPSLIVGLQVEKSLENHPIDQTKMTEKAKPKTDENLHPTKRLLLLGRAAMRRMQLKLLVSILQCPWGEYTGQHQRCVPRTTRGATVKFGR